MNLETFKTIISDFQNRELPALTGRETPVRFIANMSSAVVGARRCGKTYRTYQLVQELGAQGIDRANICRIQFNDLRLKQLGAKELLLIDEAYYSLYPQKRASEAVYFIFDEIQRVSGWEDYVLQLLDEPMHKIILTGSTSKLLKGDIASALRGKNFSVELFPFSFPEFLKHYGVIPSVTTSKEKSFLRKSLVRYLSQGGFPGLLDADESIHIELLQGFWDTMILRDIIEAHNDENINIQTFTYFSQAMIARISCPMTVRGLMKEMDSAGLKYSGETLYKYLRYLEEAFMIFTVPFYARSAKVRNRHYHKVYAIDWALAKAVSFGEGIDITRLFENMIFIELKRRGFQLSYYRTHKGFEIDFIAVSKKTTGSKPALYQVCYDMSNQETAHRELRGISECAKFLKITEATVITMENEQTIESDGVSIKVIPAWKWLLA